MCIAPISDNVQDHLAEGLRQTCRYVLQHKHLFGQKSPLQIAQLEPQDAPHQMPSAAAIGPERDVLVRFRPRVF